MQLHFGDFDVDATKFKYNQFIGLYKLHKCVAINTKAQHCWAHVDTSTIPLRPLISTAAYFRKKGSMWISMILQLVAESLQRVVVSTNQVIKMVEDHRVAASDVFGELAS